MSIVPRNSENVQLKSNFSVICLERVFFPCYNIQQERVIIVPKTILFDLDGTITDSGPGIMNCVELALAHYGIHVENREELRVFVGPPLRDTFLKFGVPESDVENAIKIFRSRYVPIGIFENNPYPGIRELLEELHKAGHRLYVATSKPETMAYTVLNHFDLAKYFDLICGATMDKSRDNKDAVIAYLLEQAPVGQEVIMVGDTHFDVLGAAAHGIPTIGVTWGYGAAEDMCSAGAVSVVHTMDELLKKLL